MHATQSQPNSIMSRKQKAIATTTQRGQTLFADGYRIERAMTASEFIAWAQAQKESRETRGKVEAEPRYGLVRIGRNGNDPRGFGCMNPDGIIYRIGEDGRTYNHETGELCPDQLRIDPINERLAALGIEWRLSTKHRTVIRTLWLALEDEQ